MNVLVLTHKLPFPLHDGYNLHNFNYVSRLSAEHGFHLVSLGSGPLPMDIAGHFASIRIVAPRDPGPPSSVMQRVARSLSVDEVFDFDPEVYAAILEVVDRVQPDVVWCAGAKMLVYSHRLHQLHGLPVLGDIADEAAKEALADLRRARKPLSVARSVKNLANTWRFQRKFLDHVRICTVVSEVDKQMLARNCPHVDVRVLPNGVDAEYYAPQQVDEDYPTLIFEGTMNFVPNTEGIITFARDVLPLIHAENPDVRLLVVGKDPPPEVQALAGPRVEVTGFVDDVRPWVGKASLFVCPLLRGAGIKNKILQAWSMEKAVVATTPSLGGLPLERGVNIEVADTPEELCETIVRLLGDPQRRVDLGRAGRRTVVENCSWDQRANELDELLFELAGVTHAKVG